MVGRFDSVVELEFNRHLEPILGVISYSLFNIEGWYEANLFFRERHVTFGVRLV